MIRDEHLPLDALVADPANYNLHSEASVALLAEQIAAVGFTAPLLVSAAGNLIEAGHRRRLALLRLRAAGAKEPEGVRAGWLVPCRVGDWDELQRLKVLVGDNPALDRVNYDSQQLAALLSELSNAGELAGSGYGEGDLETLLEELAQTAGDSGEGEDSGSAECGGGGDGRAGSLKAKDVVVKPVIYVSELATFEAAVKKTGLERRGAAVIELARFYLEQHGGEAAG